MSFPLAEWIDAHADARHNLGISGMRGELRTLPRALRHEFDPDPEALRATIGHLHGVSADRVFLTHGATEGFSLALGFLGHTIRKEAGRAPTLLARRPEYPPLFEVADWNEFATPTADQAPDVTLFSEPGNPTGTASATNELAALLSGSRRVLVDETFREFSGRPSLLRRNEVPGLWITGTLTKAYGADAHRVGWVIPARDDGPGFARYHGLMLDELPAASVTAGRAILSAREEILGESRTIFRANRAVLRRRVPGVPELVAPLWFDRGAGELPGDEVAAAAIAEGVLVCSGAFFGDPKGVRVTLTRRSFPKDLDAYLRVRSSWVAAAKRRR